MSKQTYLLILRAGSYLSLISVFLFYSGFLFPFISTKQIYFNILIEILFVFWLGLIAKYPEFRPFGHHKTKSEYISLALIAFFLVVVLSSILGVDFNLSFWGDVERMLGAFHLLHFLAFYFILISAFRSWNDWRKFFIVSIVFASFVSIKGLTGNPYSTFGNTAYVSAYLIFNIYFCAFAFLKDKIEPLKWLYLLPIPLMLAAFKNADTTGAIVGLGVSVIAIFFLYGILNKSKKIRFSFLGVFIFLVFATILIFVFKDSINNRALNQISLQKNTFQTRLLSWRAAGKDFKNHPFLGTGYGNFAITFDKYFDAKFYSYTDSETYFDRAHNNIVDITSTTGLLGLMSYLSIFIAVFYYLIRGLKRKAISIDDFVLITALIIAYFVQNLAVFDALVTYLCLMITLAFVYWINNNSASILEKTGNEIFNKVEDIKEKKENKNLEIYVLFGAGIIAIIMIYQFNIKPIKMLVGTIDGQLAFHEGDVVKATDLYKKALSYKTILDRDSRVSYLRSLSSKYGVLDNIEIEKARGIADYAIDLAKKNVRYNQEDSLNQMYLANILNTASKLYTDNQNKFFYYSDQAVEAIDKSIAASPRRVPLYSNKARILLTRRELDKAIETLEYAVTLNEDYYEAYCNLGRFYMGAGRTEEGESTIDKCIDLGGARMLAMRPMIDNLIERYFKDEDKERMLKIYRVFAGMFSDDPKPWINLAKLYKEAGNISEARMAAEKALEIDKGLRVFVERFITELESNKQ